MSDGTYRVTIPLSDEKKRFVLGIVGDIVKEFKK